MPWKCLSRESKFRQKTVSIYKKSEGYIAIFRSFRSYLFLIIYSNTRTPGEGQRVFLIESMQATVVVEVVGQSCLGKETEVRAYLIRDASSSL